MCKFCDHRDKDDDPISIGANCIVKICDKFFLIVEIEVETMDFEFEVIVIIPINKREAEDLMDAGVKRCKIAERPPKERPGVEVEPICIFIVNGKAFRIFDVENDFDEAVLVEIPLSEARRRIANGECKCTVVDRNCVIREDED